MDNWIFIDPPNTAVLTTRRILEGQAPILIVAHMDEDITWQFHDGIDNTYDEAKVVALHRIVELDPSVLSISDLPHGWMATRETVAHPWLRFEEDVEE